MREYGIPYMGSKNAIAEDVVKALPPGGKILDACCGGGAVLMALAMSMKYDAVVGNDLNKAVVKLLDAVLINKGQIDYEFPEVCSRNDFFVSLQKIENGNFDIQDCVNKYCCSFGNNGRTYLYGKDIEDYKLIAEKMLVSKSLVERRRFYNKFIDFCIADDSENERQRLIHLEHLQRLQGLERLERLERLDNCSLFDIDYSEFDIVYFDIPYKGTCEYDFKFDYERFYQLFAYLKTDLNIPAFLSEYNAPFEIVAEFQKTQLFAQNGSSKSTTKEKLYFNGTKEEYKKLMGINYNQKTEQISLF